MIVHVKVLDILSVVHSKLQQTLDKDTKTSLKIMVYILKSLEY